MKTCPTCGRSYPADRSFCVQDGTPLVGPPPTAAPAPPSPPRIGWVGLAAVAAAASVLTVGVLEVVGGDEPAPVAAEQVEAPARAADVGESVAPPVRLESARFEGPTTSGWSREPLSMGASGPGRSALVDVRAGRHDGFDRVAFEFAGDRPAVSVAYLRRAPEGCPWDSDPLPGAARLALLLDDVGPEDRAGPLRDLRARGFTSALAVAPWCEDGVEVGWVAALARAAPFRVLTLDEPSRVAVDVRHPGR